MKLKKNIWQKVLSDYKSNAIVQFRPHNELVSSMTTEIGSKSRN